LDKRSSQSAVGRTVGSGARRRAPAGARLPGAVEAADGRPKSCVHLSCSINTCAEI